MWDDEQQNETNITVEPTGITLSKSEPTKSFTISNIEIPVKEQGKWERTPKKILIIANGTMCLDADADCNVTISKTLQRNLLIEVNIYIGRGREIIRLFNNVYEDLSPYI